MRLRETRKDRQASSFLNCTLAGGTFGFTHALSDLVSKIIYEILASIASSCGRIRWYSST